MHHIDESRGIPAFISYRQPAWHGLGTTFDECLNVADALRMAQLDYTVVKAPNIHAIPEGPEIVSKNSFFTYRTDTNMVLGDKLGKGYFPVQNEDALSVVDLLVREGGMRIESAGALYSGARAFICCRIPDDLMVSGADRVKQYLVVACGHDGDMGILAYFTNVRVVCNNTLQASLKDAVQKHSIRHTRNANLKLKQVVTLLDLGRVNARVMGAAYDRMANTRITQQAFFDYLGNVFFTTEEQNKLRAGVGSGDVISTRKRNVINEVINYYENGIGQAGHTDTYWGAYNAVTGYYANAVTYDNAEGRMEALLFATSSKTMERAALLAAEPENIQSLRKSPISFNLN
jgi:phage/plasmid-like protein (TIGR03299 family)